MVTWTTAAPSNTFSNATSPSITASAPAPSTAEPAPRRRPRDPRIYQIAMLGSLLAYGVFALGFDIHPGHAITALVTALGVQAVLTRWVGLPRFDPKSPLISALSLALLLRTDALVVVLLAATVTVASKFALRAGGKHIFNPTNFGIAITLLLVDNAWVSSGQWGSAALLAFALAGLGGLVVRRAERSDVTWAFLAAYACLLFGRAAWLGDPLAIPLHQLESGAFLIFAFFMISDPKTTPSSRPGRVLYAVLVAALAGWIRFGLYEPNELIWALVLMAPTVPLIDRLLPGATYAWPGGHNPKES